MTKARDRASAAPAPSTVSATELGYLDGVTSAVQTQLDAKAPSSTAVTLTGTQTLTNKTLTNPVIASVINNTLTSTTGDIIYASSANTPARLGIGSTGQVLTVASGIPSWAAAGGSSKVVQIVMGNTSTQTITTSTTLVDTGLSASITPTSASNKVLVFVTQNGLGKTAASTNTSIEVALLRGSTNIQMIATRILEEDHAANTFIGGVATTIYLDSPATTSATTYKTQFRNSAAGYQVLCQTSSANSTICLMEVTP